MRCFRAINISILYTECFNSINIAFDIRIESNDKFYTFHMYFEQVTKFLYNFNDTFKLIYCFIDLILWTRGMKWSSSKNNMNICALTFRDEFFVSLICLFFLHLVLQLLGKKKENTKLSMILCTVNKSQLYLYYICFI